MKHYTNLISLAFGRFAEKEFPAFIQGTINNSYVKFLGLDMGEFKAPYKYASLNKLFTRKLENQREFDGSEEAIISPSDSLVTVVGKADGDEVYQIKGVSYKLHELMTKINLSTVSKLHNGDYINLYLSPKDYHRYHLPLDLEIQKCVYVPAKLYPVNFPALKNIKNLFCENERVLIQGVTNSGKTIIIVLVGALNVGKMVVNFEPSIDTNSNTEEILEFEYEDLKLKKGEELGYFKMGSTVLIFAEENTLEFTIEENSKVSFAQTIGKMR